MIKKNIVRAEFFRNSGVACIDIYLPGWKQPLSLFEGIVYHCSKALSEKEIAEVIGILSRKKEAMLKQHNFPQICDELLSELIEAQRERYGVRVKKEKKRKLGYSVSIDKLEEILGEYYKIKDVHAYSIDIGSDRSNAERIDVESDYRYLVLSFREVVEDDETHSV